MEFEKKPIFKIVLKRVERPYQESLDEEFKWICQTMGFFEAIDKDKTASNVLKEVILATELNRALTSTQIAEKIGMSRGATSNHLRNLMRSGIIIKDGRYYMARSRSFYRTIEELEDEVELIFKRLKKIAKEIDNEFESIRK